MLKTLYEDDHILVIDKPPGLVVSEIPGMLARLDSRLAPESTQGAAERAARLAHRLDKDTSGILLIAKTTQALDNLQHQFKQRLVKKEYLALAHGTIMEKGRVEGAVGRNPGNREKFIVLSTGKQAVTEYEPLESLQLSAVSFQQIFDGFNKIQMRKLDKTQYNQFTLMRCFPKTGRTHQIRVHLKYIGHPIVADDKYGGRRWVRLDKRWCPRMFLHAAKIGFRHPATGEWMEVESPLPEDLKKVLWITFLYNWP